MIIDYPNYILIWPEALDIFYDMLQGKKWKWVGIELWPATFEEKMLYRYGIICEPKDLMMVRYPEESRAWYYPTPFRHARLEQGEFERNKVREVSYVFPPVW